MKTIFKTYGMMKKQEMTKLENNAKNYLEELNGEPVTEGQIYEVINNDISFSYEDEQTNLNINLDNNILCIANIGRWNGRYNSAKVLSNNLKEILNFFGCDEINIYLDGQNIKSSGYHHDGRNYYEFREIKEGANIETLINKIIRGDKISRSLLSYYTKPLGRKIKEVYGW